MCNVIYDIILFDIGFLFKISIYIYQIHHCQTLYYPPGGPPLLYHAQVCRCDKVTDHCIALASWVMVAGFRELDARGTYNFDRSGSRAGKKNRAPIRDSTARQPLIYIDIYFLF